MAWVTTLVPRMKPPGKSNGESRFLSEVVSRLKDCQPNSRTVQEPRLWTHQSWVHILAPQLIIKVLLATSPCPCKYQLPICKMNITLELLHYSNIY